jgi:hypothetical protein
MENLSETLTIANATIEDWTHRKTEKDGLKLHFNVSAPLPKPLAEQLRCAGIYDMDTGRIELLHKLKETELLIPVPGCAPNCSSFFPDVIYKFKASRDEEQFTIAFSVHISTRAEEMHEILKGAPDKWDIVVRPRQGQLFEGGTRVEVKPGERVISQEQAHDTSAATDAPGAAPLAQAATMGGTHQKRKPREDKGTVN